jgi:hypothetical protein
MADFNDDLLITKHMNDRLIGEAQFEDETSTDYWVVRQRANGQLIERSVGYKADIAETMIAKFIIVLLNREIRHDGAWIVAWTNAGRRFVMIWMDKDGDVQFTVEAGDVAELADADPLHWVDQCEEAWRLWNNSMRNVLAPNDNQIFKRAQGQRAPSATRG